MTMNSYVSNSYDAESGNGGLEEVKIPTIQGVVFVARVPRVTDKLSDDLRQQPLKAYFPLTPVGRRKRTCTTDCLKL